MTTYREFTLLDLFKFNQPTFDSYIFTYSISRYIMHYLDYNKFSFVAEHPNGEIMGYLIGKTDGSDEDLHGHVTSLTVSPQYRRLGIATKLLEFLENASERVKTLYVDLFVRPENTSAIALYESSGYELFCVHKNMYQGTYDGKGKAISAIFNRDFRISKILDAALHKEWSFKHQRQELVINE